MKLEKWAVITEVVSGLAVVISLVVLIVEVRGNTDAVRSQTAQATFAISAQSFYFAEGNVALDKWFSGEAQLTTEEAAQARALLADLDDL